MKITYPLDDVFDSAVKVKILRFLIRTGAEWNGRQISKEIRVSPATAHKALQALHGQGVLVMRNVGKTHIYDLNEGNYLVNDLLRPLFDRENRVLNCIIDLIRKKIHISRIMKNIISVCLFGSVSTGKDNPASDIDLAVIVRSEKDRDGVEKLFEAIDKKVFSEFGNTVSPYINTEAEFRSKHRKGADIVTNILKSNKLIYGKEIDSIL